MLQPDALAHLVPPKLKGNAGVEHGTEGHFPCSSTLSMEVSIEPFIPVPRASAGPEISK